MDQGVPAQSARGILEINIIDINDKPPKFTEKLYTINIIENAPIGTFLTNITADDSDMDAKLTYKVVGFTEAKLDDGTKVDINKYDCYFFKF